MRLLIILFILCLALPSQARISDMAYEIFEIASQTEQKLNSRQKRRITAQLVDIKRELLGYHRPSKSLVCLSNGRIGSFEKFAPYFNNRQIGELTTFAKCNTTLTNVRHEFMCVSNGRSGNFEKFAVYDLFQNYQIGEYSQFKNCLNVVEYSSSQYICLSNGRRGTLEKHFLYSRQNKSTIGGGTSLNRCLGSIPR